ncbi:hypothetical protein Tco_1335751 [Tanacetum coccineum]
MLSKLILFMRKESTWLATKWIRSYARKPRIGTLERNNLRLGGTLCVETKRVDRLRHSTSSQKELQDRVPHPGELQDCSSKGRMDPSGSKGLEERTANKNDKTTGVAYIDLETENRCSSPPSMNISHDDFELTVAETPNYNEPLTVKKEPINEAYSTTIESVSEVDFSHSTIIQTNFPHQQLPHSFTSPCLTSASAFNTPKKQHISHNRSPLYSSVNSHVHKRRKSSPPVTVKMKQYDSPDPKTPKEINKFSVPRSCILDVPEASSTTCGDVTKKELKISCSLCRNPLGLVENNYFVSCSVTSLSMVHLATIWKGIAIIWKEENPSPVLNFGFILQLLFYFDRLKIQHIKASMNSKCILYAANTRHNAASSNLVS